MDDVTEQNAALVEEAAAAVGSPQEQVSTLEEVVSIFKIGKDAIAGPGSRPSMPKGPAARGTGMHAAANAPAIARAMSPRGSLHENAPEDREEF